MFLTEKEIFNQYIAARKTYKYLINNAEKIRKFRDSYAFESLTFIGCGSGYSLCQSGEISSKIRLNVHANSFAAGDLMLNFPHYKNLLKDTLLIAPSRSGSTSEVVKAVQKAKEELNTPCIAISAREDVELSKIADLSLEIPWAFDESVCQTRTVTNLYIVNLMLIGIMANDNNLLEEIKQAIENGENYMEQYKSILQKVVKEHAWEKVVVLADSELQGIADEGAIAFKEIPQIQSNYYHILDVRHGPSVLIDDKTLVVMACSSYGISYQQDLIRDIKKQGALIVTVSSEAQTNWGSDYNVVVPSYGNYGVIGIPFIFVPQVLSYYKAIAREINPDVPEGLAPWIKL